ncbi:MAG TPA: class I SAM-dependent methyltransferase [Verrucomicrobiae bacterium]|nr:class I SAM-dependent methyltransferase [Verrucomicrobiae bacterium]
MAVSHEKLVELFTERFTRATVYPVDIKEQMSKLSGKERIAALEAIRRVVIIKQDLPSNLVFSAWWESRDNYFVLCLELFDYLKPEDRDRMMLEIVDKLKSSGVLASSKRVRETVERIQRSGPQITQELCKKHKLVSFLR